MNKYSKSSLVLQEVIPTLVPTSFVSLEDSAVHDPPNVVKFVRVDVVEGCNVVFFIVSDAATVSHRGHALRACKPKC